MKTMIKAEFITNLLLLGFDKESSSPTYLKYKYGLDYYLVIYIYVSKPTLASIHLPNGYELDKPYDYILKIITEQLTELKGED